LFQTGGYVVVLLLIHKKRRSQVTVGILNHGEELEGSIQHLNKNFKRYFVAGVAPGPLKHRQLRSGLQG
jgi:hypothetical protein